MKGTKTTLQDVYKKLIEMIDYNTILIGHSLDCDLRALKVGEGPDGFSLQLIHLGCSLHRLHIVSFLSLS